MNDRTDTQVRKRSARRCARGCPVRVLAVLTTVAGVIGTVALDAGAQTMPGGVFGAGKVVSVSGTEVKLERTDPQTSDVTQVAVTLTDSTSFRKEQTTTADGIATGGCVRVGGTGSAKKGIKATSIAITATSASDCTARPGTGSGGPPGGVTNGFPGGGTNGFPGGGTNGTPPSSLPRPPRGRGRSGTAAFGTVTSVSADRIVLKGIVLSGGPRTRRGSGGSSRGAPRSLPNQKPKRVTVTLSSSTTITETVDATAADLTVGACASAAGTGDAQAITADRITISQPVDGACDRFTGVGFGPGGPGGA